MDLESPRKRILAGMILLILLVSLCIYHAAEYENNLEYPSYEAILTDPPLGALVYVYGTVNQQYSGGFDIQQDYNNQLVTMHINSEKSPPKNKYVNLIGVLGPDHQIISIKEIHVTEAWKDNFILLRSLIALIFLLYIFHRYWYFQLKRFEFWRR